MGLALVCSNNRVHVCQCPYFARSFCCRSLSSLNIILKVMLGRRMFTSGSDLTNFCRKQTVFFHHRVLLGTLCIIRVVIVRLLLTLLWLSSVSPIECIIRFCQAGLTTNAGLIYHFHLRAPYFHPGVKWTGLACGTLPASQTETWNVLVRTHPFRIFHCSHNYHCLRVTSSGGSHYAIRVASAHTGRRQYLHMNAVSYADACTNRHFST